MGLKVTALIRWLQVTKWAPCRSRRMDPYSATLQSVGQRGRGDVVSPLLFTFPPSLARRPSAINAPISAGPTPTSNAPDVAAFRECAATEEASSCVGSFLRLPLHQGTATSGTNSSIRPLRDMLVGKLDCPQIQRQRPGWHRANDPEYITPSIGRGTRRFSNRFHR